jgi:diguanylate cyclase (GGDEF)-like protein/PAS domain S-box-containing protein
MSPEGRSTTNPALRSAREKERIDVPGTELFAALVESADDAIVTTTLDGRIVTWNRGAERLYGYAAADVVGQPTTFLFPDDLRDELGEVAQRLAQRSRVEHYESVRVHRTGRRVDVSVSVSPVLEGDRVVAIASIARDITGRKHVERMINHLAFHDGLTGLANRMLIRDRLQHALARSNRAGGFVAVIYLDLDDFKEVNDRLGHAAGDQLLQAVAARLQPLLRPGDTFGRLGGDEFVVVSDRIPNERAAIGIAERLEAALAEPFEFDAARIEVTASIGVAMGDSATDADRLLANADRAMYVVKARGGAGITSFALPAASR